MVRAQLAGEHKAQVGDVVTVAGAETVGISGRWREVVGSFFQHLAKASTGGRREEELKKVVQPGNRQ